MGRIINDIYSDTLLAPLLGFKGGTCAYFFYGLTRFSVDLDFDCFSTDAATHQKIFEKVKGILEHHGTIKRSRIKRYTIFCLLSYGDVEHNIKVEINIRPLMPNIKLRYALKEYLGTSMFVGEKEYLFASKLAALTLRSETAMRDIYDVWFFAENIWDIDAEVIMEKTGKSIPEYLADCIALIERVKESEILRGLGELLPGEKEKAWVKTHLRKEAIFLLKNYQAVLGRKES
jgi:predicted nucleotidyltransferase component of viral defense system